MFYARTRQAGGAADRAARRREPRAPAPTAANGSVSAANWTCGVRTRARRHGLRRPAHRREPGHRRPRGRRADAKSRARQASDPAADRRRRRARHPRPATLSELVEAADTVINLVGILHETGRETSRARTSSCAKPDRRVPTCGVRRLVHMSALGAASMRRAGTCAARARRRRSSRPRRSTGPSSGRA